MPNQIPDKGDCYEASVINANSLTELKTNTEKFMTIYDTLGLQDTIEVVHGFATPSAGPAAGKRIHHAWIEVGDYVIETQGGTQSRRDKSEYYKMFRIEVDCRYSVEQANACVKKYGGYGNWKARGNEEGA